MSMNRWLATAAVFVVICSLLWWQVEQNGELQASNDQYISTIDDLTAALNEQAARNKETHTLLADTRVQLGRAQHKARSLSDDLKNLSGCANTVISDAVIERVQQFSAGQD